MANELGSAKPLRAERAAYTAIALETLLMLGIVAVGFGLRDVWAYLFTDDPEVSAVPAGRVSGCFFCGRNPSKCLCDLLAWEALHC